MEFFVNQFSEIGKLNTVLLHRPDVEITSIMPDYLSEMLAEDTPHLPAARKEHDAFAEILRQNGVEVLYLKELFCEVIGDRAVREAFIGDYVELCAIQGDGMRRLVTDYLLARDAEGVFRAVFKGITYQDLQDSEIKPMRMQITDPYPFVTDPIPNAYFTRDIAISVGNGMILSCMSKHSRKREALPIRYIHRYHPLFNRQYVPLWYDYEKGWEIEGGDVLVLSDKLLAIGCGERTSVAAVECVANRLFENGYERILLFNNPKSRKFMHLDVLCTMVDYDKFLVHPCIAEKYFEVYELTKSSAGLRISLTTDPVSELLRRALKLPAVQFIEVGGGDPLISAREHWNMGSNSLAISPGHVVTYERNEVTNELLTKAGIRVDGIPGSELSRGRGGPRCMSMPINRSNIW